MEDLKIFRASKKVEVCKIYNLVDYFKAEQEKNIGKLELFKDRVKKRGFRNVLDIIIELI